MPPNAHVSYSSCCPASHCTKFPSFSRGTYARELGAAVTALGDGASLLDVKQTDITTGSLDDSSSVGGGVVAVRQIVSYGLGLRYTARRFDFERAKASTCPLRRRY